MSTTSPRSSRWVPQPSASAYFKPSPRSRDPGYSSSSKRVQEVFRDIEKIIKTYVLSTDHYQVELLANLERVPESGALVVVSFPKPKDGSGFPPRVLAILP